MPSALRTLLAASVALGTLLTGAAAAQRPATHGPARPGPAPASTAPAANGPKSIGKFDDWQAATHMEGDQTVCYAFTVASKSAPSLPGRGQVVLTVTERGAARDAVAMSAGFAYAGGAEVQMSVDGTNHPFYTDKRNAFAREGKALVSAFTKSRSAQAKSPGPRNSTVTDDFSLRGFSPAYAAITKACPPK